jgi:hypothetical protein
MVEPELMEYFSDSALVNEILMSLPNLIKKAEQAGAGDE